MFTSSFCKICIPIFISICPQHQYFFIHIQSLHFQAFSRSVNMYYSLLQKHYFMCSSKSFGVFIPHENSNTCPTGISFRSLLYYRFRTIAFSSNNIFHCGKNFLLSKTLTCVVIRCSLFLLHLISF